MLAYFNVFKTWATSEYMLFMYTIFDFYKIASRKVFFKYNKQTKQLGKRILKKHLSRVIFYKIVDYFFNI